jgi:hypothetical protein
MHYRQLIGEFIWPMIKCRPDISFHVTKLSQFMANPAEAHYQALRSIGSYLANTIDTGIYYWRDTPRQDFLRETYLQYTRNHTHSRMTLPRIQGSSLHMQIQTGVHAAKHEIQFQEQSS